MTKSLTKQWKDGTIKEGLYFIKTKHTRCYKEETDMLFPDGCRAAFSIYPIVEVLAPVPSYEEYKQLVSKADELVQKIHILNEQNTKQYNELCEEIKKNNILEKKLAIATKVMEHLQGFDSVSRALKEIEKWGVK